MTSTRRVEYVARLGATVRYRHIHERVRARIVHFALQLEIPNAGEWWAVVRYDTSHGFAHRDLLDRDGVVQKTPLFTMDYNDALTFAENDLRANWEHYRDLFLKGVQP